MSYSTDDRGVLWNGKPIKGADAATFQIFDGALAKDRAHVYLNGKPANADAESFERLSNCYGRDKFAVFVIMKTRLKPLNGADPASFRSLGETYGVDSARSWYLDKPLRLTKSAGSPAQFRELAKD